MKACPFCAEDIPDAATVCEHCNWELDELPTAAGSRWLRPFAMMAAAVVVLGMFGVLGSAMLRARAPQPSPNVPTNLPVTLADAVENLPANSWKAVPLNLPHDGVLAVEVGVARGNPVNVFVTTSADMQQMRGDDVTTVRRYPGFDATMTKQFLREAQLTAGTYYLVLQEPGNLSASVSDVSIQANLRR